MRRQRTGALRIRIDDRDDPSSASLDGVGVLPPHQSRSDNDRGEAFGPGHFRCGRQ